MLFSCRSHLKETFLTLLLSFFLVACVTYRGDLEFDEPQELFYTKSQSVRQKGLLYLPKGRAQSDERPLVMLVHGGGWSSRTLDDMEAVAESLASNGFIVFNINYRLAPQFKHPAPAEDLLSATQFIQKHLAAKSIKVNKLALWGYSSGAHTVSFFALSTAPKFGVKVDAVVAGGGPYDLSFYPESPYLKKYLGYFRRNKIEEYDNASPINFVTTASPKFFLFHAREDQLVEWVQTTAFEAELERKKIIVESYLVPFWGHETLFLFSKASVKRGILFLKKHL